jgi:flagellar protein FlaI
MKSMGLTEEELREELHRRKTVLEWMARNNIRKHTDVTVVIRDYYADPARVYRKARMGMP